MFEFSTLLSNMISCISYVILSVCLGLKPASQNGTDVLLDLLSIGTPPPQSDSSTSDILSSVQDNKLPVAPLDGLLSPSTPVTPVIDLLDGFAVKPPTPGKIKILEVFGSPFNRDGFFIIVM